MAKTPSNMIPLGTAAPQFELPEPLTGNLVNLVNVKSEVATVIMFICNHCPFVKHIQDKVAEVAANYSAKGIQFIAINSNDVDNYPEDAPDKMAELAKTTLKFPYLFDESQSVAKAYDAACTPDFYVFDKDLKLAYRGRFDAATPGNDVDVTGDDLKQALDALLQQKAITIEQLPSVGCNIKWKN